GIIGYGPFGQNLARLALNTTKIDVNMIYSYAEDTALLEKIEANGFRATADVDELINSDDVEAIIVASPNALHKEHILKVCAVKKALWAEKPLVLNLDDCDEVIAAVQAAGVVSHCNMSMRFGAITRKTLELKNAGEFGTMMHFISRSSRGVGLFSMGNAHKAVLTPELSGGWIKHHMCHQVDYAIQLFGERVKSVYAQAVKSDPACPSEESISAILTFENGGIADLSDGLAPQGDHFFSVIGSKGSAYEEHKRLVFRNQLDENDYGHGGHSTLFTPEGWGDDHITAFYAAVTGEDHGRNYELNVVPINDDSRHLLEVEVAICESVQSGNVVHL
ncbi:MAG: Gfo/Idh/MocA family oxidoreductase, partial [Planctomycetes bacterium]|nr:Gfo/Idh/MocA family oxidoreductase [Planctomycetota bacterium]